MTTNTDNIVSAYGFVQALKKLGVTDAVLYVNAQVFQEISDTMGPASRHGYVVEFSIDGVNVLMRGPVPKYVDANRE